MTVCILDDTLELPSLMLDVMLLSLLIGIELGDMKYVLCWVWTSNDLNIEKRW